MKTILSLLSILILVYLSSCNEIIEPDVSDVKITILTPRDSLISSANIQSFFWESSMENVPCRIQIVKPSFDQIDYFVDDTLVNSNRYEITLPADIYSWRIRPENDNSHGEYQYFTLIVDSSSNLTDFKVQIVHPFSNQFLSFNDSLTLNWNPVPEAQQFEYIISNQTNILETHNITTNNIVHLNLGEGYYSAKVRAQGSFTNTAYAEINFAIDTSAPTSISQIFPTNNHVFNSNQIAISWGAPTNEISPERDSLYFYTDASGNSIISKLSVSANSLDTTLSTGVYYWSVKRFDQVGLQSPYKVPNRFFVQ